PLCSPIPHRANRLSLRLRVEDLPSMAKSPENGPSPGDSSRGIRRAAQVVIVSSVMFTFISFWRTAAVVLCDLASTVYYIGGIVESAIGPSAPWFILAVMI